MKEGLQPLKAAERLDIDLHSRLEKVRSQFLIGEYELAAFAAMREVEIRVRELANADESSRTCCFESWTATPVE